jgi:hypothetical protein
MKNRNPEQKATHAKEENSRYWANREAILSQQREYYSTPEGKAKKRANSREQHKKQVARRRKFDLLKLDRPCYDCGGVFPPEAMDWDHKPGVTKSFGVSSAMGGNAKPFDAVVDEIAKCDLVCACCHRIRTQNRRAA